MDSICNFLSLIFLACDDVPNNPTGEILTKIFLNSSGSKSNTFDGANLVKNKTDPLHDNVND